MSWGTILLIVLIFLAAIVLAGVSLRRDPGRRGSAPGKGHHTLRSDYNSGMGGGNSAEWQVPRDPQAYAKRFIPKGKTK
ncbi:hypothetical protein [Roseovarius aestuariivivens]|uniref:hypothetical protein n=1 Tax=Roseovarius aestuariivivens TaxID=1888910 RepID=UPI0010820614|nr:hypothetical protein [Roseovarius aestuariivivens]